jgi:hypothetical protein
LPRPDWTLRLAQPFSIPRVMSLATLADVRKLLGHLPKEYRDKSTWRYIADRLNDAARGGELNDVVVPLGMVLSMEGIACRPR